jgi:hypothetical protein
MSAELIELSNALAQATERAAANVVAVHTEARGSASGVVWCTGIIVTAEHALRRDEEIHATLPDGRVVLAILAGRDPSTDLAVLKCAEAFAAVPNFGNVASLKPGMLGMTIWIFAHDKIALWILGMAWSWGFIGVWGPVTTYTAEMYPTRIRGVGNGFSWAIAFLIGAVLLWPFVSVICARRLAHLPPHFC